MDTSSSPASPLEVIRPALEQFLARFHEVHNVVPFGQHDELKQLMEHARAGLQELPALRRHPHVKVNWSVGVGEFAKIPWIAFLDDRETDSPRRGTYCVLLFAEDMSCVYLTLNQGVTDILATHRRTAARGLLRDRAATIRAHTTELSAAGFRTDNGIDLQTDSPRGGDYEASTIAYKRYAKGEVPPDITINHDLTVLVDAYARVLSQKAKVEDESTGFWIFQANPKVFDIDSALAELPELTWTVKSTAEQAALGDKVFLWRSGHEAGIVGTATVIEAATEMELPSAEAAFVLDKEKFAGTHRCVRISVDRHLNPPLPRTAIAAEPLLKDLMILRFAQLGTFAVPPHHAEALINLLDEAEPLAQAPSSRVWLYAPGRNAEHWDEFYEQGIMAIGWDDLGDLSQFGSVEDVIAALEQAYHPETRPTNDARTCYDFVRTIKPGDLIFAKRGKQRIVGYGIVMGEYQYQPERTVYQSIRTVRWEGRGAWISPNVLAIKTLTDLTGAPDVVQGLKKLVTVLPEEPPTPVPPTVREAFSLDQALDGLFMPRSEFERALAIWRAKKNLILQGAPGVGKSFIAKRLAYALMGYRDPSRVRTVQFHQSYSYEDFIQGYRPDGNGGFALKSGLFLEFCERALSDPSERYVFIIDEINRGNLSKILGELMLLIEPDKRSSEWATKLAYAQSAEERFYVPPNVHLLGMMNTADRSLSMVDYALRRRFAFVTLRPEYTTKAFRNELAAKGVPSELIDRIVARMGALNADIADDKSSLGPGFCLGHSFFASIAESVTPDNNWYRQIIDTEVGPLLDEYWFDNPERASEWRERLLAE